MALGQSSGEDYVGQKTQQNQFVPDATPEPLSCPYPPCPPLNPEATPMIQGVMPPYQGNLKEDPEEYYHTGKSPAKLAVQKGN